MPHWGLSCLWLQAQRALASTVLTVLSTEASWQKGWEAPHLNIRTGRQGRPPSKADVPTP